MAVYVGNQSSYPLINLNITGMKKDGSWESVFIPLDKLARVALNAREVLGISLHTP